MDNFRQENINNRASEIHKSVNVNKRSISDGKCDWYTKNAIRKLNGSPYTKYRYNFYNRYYKESIKCVIYAEIIDK